MIRSAYDGILGAPPNAHPQPFEIVLESPTHAPMESQRDAFASRSWKSSRTTAASSPTAATCET